MSRQLLLSQISRLKKLSLSHCGLRGAETEQILNLLSSLQHPLKELDLSWNRIGSSGTNAIAKVLHIIEVLNLSQCELDGVNIEMMGRTLKSLSYSFHMNELDLSSNVIGDDGACHLAGGLHRVSKLNLNYCFITDIGAKAIGEALSKLPAKMNELDLSWNNEIGDDGVRHLARGLHRVSTLNLKWCNITTVGAKIIGEALTKLPDNMNELDLGCNKKIGDEGARHLAGGLHRVSTLKLEQCNITDVGVKAIGDALTKLVEKMNELDLGDNAISDDGARYLAKGLHRVASLNLKECNITVVGANAIGDSLLLLQNKMNEIVLSHNKIEDNGACHLAKGLHRVSTLNLKQCNISDIGAKAIGDSLTLLQNKMNELDLSWNNEIGDDGARHLARGLHRVCRLKLTYCKITNIGAKIIGDALTKLTEKMNELDVGDSEISDIGIFHLARGLHRVSTLKLEYCNITAVGARALGDALALLPKKRHRVEGLDNHHQQFLNDE